jgi:hypothetical protein
LATNNKNFKVKNGLDVYGNISAMASSGDEGGEIFLNKAVTNTTITGGVTIDVYQNKLRFFEQGGSARGAYIDLTATSAGVSTNLLTGGGGSSFTDSAGLAATLSDETGFSTGAKAVFSISPTITGTANINNLTISSGGQSTSTLTGALVIDGGIGLNGNIYAGGNLVLTGDLTVNGNTTTLNTATLDVEDNIITVNSGVTGSPTLNGGLEINRGTSNDVSILWNETYDYWTMTNDGTNYLPLSQQTTIYLNNSTGSTIAALTPVYVSSVDVSTNTSYMSPVASTGSPAIGITRGSVSTGSGGWVITSGMIEGIDTSSLADVTYYYVSATGTLTTTAPATGIQKLLFCIKSSATVGKLYILPSSGERTSYQAYNSNLASIAALTADGIIRKTSGTWAMDSATYLTSAVTSITAGTGLSGSTITSTGTIALATAYGDTTNPYASKTANYVLASPTGTAGVPTFRALLAADIPTLGNITNSGAIGSTANLVAVTTTSGVLTTATATSQSATTFLRGDLSWVTPTDTNFYPTAFAWTAGTTSGPTGSLTGTGMSAVSYAAIPSANDTTASGIVTTTTQTFGGAKTFSSNITVPGIATSVTAGTFSIADTGLTGTLNIGGAVAGNINIGSSSSTTVIAGNLTVNGTTTTINATTLSVDDINIELGSVTTPTDTTASGGGITLKGATDKIISWATTAGTGNTNTGYWTSTENLNLSGTSKAYFINGVSVLNANTLGSGITASSLTSLGTLASLNVDTVNFDTFSTSAFTNANGTTIQNVAVETVSYRTAEYIVQCTDTTGAKYRSSKIMVLLTSATTAEITEYAILESSANVLPITFTITAATSFVTLKGQFSSAPTNTVTVKVMRIGMT